MKTSRNSEDGSPSSHALPASSWCFQVRKLRNGKFLHKLEYPTSRKQKWEEELVSQVTLYWEEILKTDYLAGWMMELQWHPS